MQLVNKSFAVTLLTVAFSLPVITAEVAANEQSLDVYEPQLNEEFKKLLRASKPEDGERFFMRKCSSCHDQKESGGHFKGPHLWNLYGRKAGSIPGFDFSPAMNSSGHVWNWATLNHYLTDTEAAVPGRTMNFRGIGSDKARARLLRYLMQFNSNPPQLP